MATNSSNVFVYADWAGLDGPVLMGRLHAQLLRGKEVFSFQYDRAWLKTRHAFNIDPDLGLYAGPQFLNDSERPNFGVFLDSSPDRWGRLLMRRREAAKARKEKREENRLFELDYLLGVYDGHRMGGLRFKRDEQGPFLDNNEKLASPPWTSIRELEQISLRLEEENAMDDPDYLNWLNMLVAPGSSLGGGKAQGRRFGHQGASLDCQVPQQERRLKHRRMGNGGPRTGLRGRAQHGRGKSRKVLQRLPYFFDQKV